MHVDVRSIDILCENSKSTSRVSPFAQTWWYATSSADTRLFPLPVLAGARQGPPQGQLRFESANAVGGHDRRGMKGA